LLLPAFRCKSCFRSSKLAVKELAVALFSHGFLRFCNRDFHYNQGQRVTNGINQGATFSVVFTINFDWQTYRFNYGSFFTTQIYEAFQYSSKFYKYVAV
jgi:hypothetical protein